MSPVCRSRSVAQPCHHLPRARSRDIENLLAGLVAYTYTDKKPSLDLEVKGLPALPPAIF